MLFDLSDRAKLRLTGADRVRFLNGQVTNDVRKANNNLSMPACVVNAKGRLDAFVFITASDDALYLDVDAELRVNLQSRLERYIIADDVEIADVSERDALFHVTAETAPTLPNGSNWRRAKRFGKPGWDLVAPANERDLIRQELAAEIPLCDAVCAEQLRIEQGVPRWGRELTNEIIPVEANLADDAIDYAKGCYIGQEVVSRMKMSGQTNKRLCGLTSLRDTPLAVGIRLTSMNDEGKEIGWITSAVRSDRLGKEIALGYVKRGYNEIGTRLKPADASSPDSQTIEIVALPFH
ncbi:MAG TPA: glycine cleavage T C-terminal barrel domain-containing protein [Chthoniobacterales bacterium]|jgi:folate-binding protein YgfZ